MLCPSSPTGSNTVIPLETIVNENQSKGAHVLSFDKSAIAVGNYFFKISTTTGTETKKIIIADF